MHGQEDYFVTEEHTDRNYEAYAGEDKQIKKCSGDHNSVRPDGIVGEILTFFRQHLLSGDELA